jgi:hypothetical protein
MIWSLHHLAVIRMICLNLICPVNDGTVGVCHCLGVAINNIEKPDTLGKAMEGMPRKIDERDVRIDWLSIMISNLTSVVEGQKKSLDVMTTKHVPAYAQIKEVEGKGFNTVRRKKLRCLLATDSSFGGSSCLLAETAASLPLQIDCVRLLP